MMGLDKIFFLEGPFWRLRGTDDLFFFFWSSRPIVTAVYYGEVRLVVGARFGVEGRMGQALHDFASRRCFPKFSRASLSYRRPLSSAPPPSRMCPQP
jgi:hypothetical protein